MNFVYSYIDFLVKTFDVKSNTSRKCYWAVFVINTALSVLLTSVGLVMPQGKPLEIYIGLSSVIATPLFIPFFTIIGRRLNDTGRSRTWLWLMLLPGAGLIPLSVFCAFRSASGTREDFTAYRNGAFFVVAQKFASSALTVFPFIYLPYSLYKLITATDTFGVGLNASMLSVHFILCVFTVIRAKTSRFDTFLSAWKTIKGLTALSSATLSILFYGNSQNFIDAFFTVYLYVYVFVAPFILLRTIIKLFSGRNAR